MIVPTAAIAVLGYFGFHALNGEFGLVGRARIEHQVVALEEELADLRRTRENLTAKVMLLRPESLDPDMIDERARASLNLANTQELVILRPWAVN